MNLFDVFSPMGFESLGHIYIESLRHMLHRATAQLII